MKKILVIEDFGALVEKLTQVAKMSSDPFNVRDVALVALEKAELKDVMEFEATVQKIDWYALNEKRTLSAIVNPPNVKPGDKLRLFAVKKKKLPSFADMKGIFRKKEEPDEQKSR